MSRSTARRSTNRFRRRIGARQTCASAITPFSLSQAGQTPPLEGVALLFDLVVPGMAALTFLLVASLFSGLVPDRAVSFPLTVTGPIVFAALMAAWATLLGTMRSSMVALPEPMVAATSWGQVDRLLPATVGQIVALGLWALIARRTSHR